MKMPKQIIVKTTRGKSITVHVETSDTIFRVKQKISRQWLLPERCQGLIFAGIRLEDIRTVTEYGIGQDSTLLCVMRPLDEIQIYVKTMEPLDGSSRLWFSSKPIALTMSASSSIFDVKTRLCDISNILPSNQGLVYNGKLLEEDSTLQGHNIHDKATLWGVLKKKKKKEVRKFKVVVKTLTEVKVITLDVGVHGIRTAIIRAKCLEAWSIPPGVELCLCWAGKQLDDDYIVPSWAGTMYAVLNTWN